MTEVTRQVFYSWQSDLPENINLDFIQACLTEAIDTLNNEESEEQGIVIKLDRDTKDTGGSLDIAQTIFDKIDKSHVFVADVSFVGKTTKGKQLPNSNVMIELGYAARSLSWDNLVLVLNLETGKPEGLPFNFRQRDLVTYSLPLDSNEEEISQCRSVLIEKLKSKLVITYHTQKQLTPEAKRDQMVARQFKQALDFFSMYLTGFVNFSESPPDNAEELFNILQLAIPNQDGKHYAAPELVKPWMDFFNNNSVFEESNAEYSGRKVSWIETFIDGFQRLSMECRSILQRYAATGNPDLIGQIEEINRRSQDLSQMFSVVNSYDGMREIYADGIIRDDHLDLVRYFILERIKSNYVISKYI